jgi:predicted CXXCH cytochrome family protein
MAFAALALAVPCPAGDWHKSATLKCSDCHTMHNSQAGQPMRYDNVAAGAGHLLRASSALALCEYCHDGRDPSSPDVVAPVAGAYAGVDPAGGAFPGPGAVSSPLSHDLGLGVPQLPPYGTQKVVLDCVTCHDPHGNDVYRNLRPSPTGRSAGVPIVVDQKVIANGTNPASVYATSNLTYRSGLSAWCVDCHDQYATGGGHPYDLQIFGAQGADYTIWQQTISNRVRVDTPTDTLVPSQDDRVECVSCHKAHGSPNTNSLIYSDGQTLDSTCSQCHGP